ncbi:MAG: FISUMP domain-containing protein [Bacteroidales bacterium]|nr:FISUMP domain-containing protein [Bacteroidales bacterium]
MKKIFLLLAGLAFLPGKNQSQTVTDFDGNVYDTVIIGTQVWLKENLKVTHYNNGDPIPNVTGTTAWAGLATGGRCYYDNDSAAFDSVYGSLYNWYAVNNINNLCPSGWRVPTDPEWSAAETYLGGTMIAGGKMKEAGTLHWHSPNTGATNSSGFTGLPGGMRDPISNNFNSVGENGFWWTSSAYPGVMAWSTYMWYLFAGVDHNPGTKRYGFSVRCMKDLATGSGNDNHPGKIKTYPNPSINRITVESAEYQGSLLLVYNISGEIVMQKALTEITTNLDISSLPNGIYLIKITGGWGTIQQKLIKN